VYTRTECNGSSPLLHFNHHQLLVLLLLSLFACSVEGVQIEATIKLFLERGLLTNKTVISVVNKKERFGQSVSSWDQMSSTTIVSRSSNIPNNKNPSHSNITTTATPSGIKI
jgi:hypothetical protein